jgi:hypothetical protein
LAPNKVSMKRILLLFTLLFATNIYAQDTENLESATFYNWNNGDWENWLYQIWTYNSQGHADTITYKMWNSASASWVNYILSTRHYNADESLAYVINQNWDGNAWVNNTKGTNTYDSGGKLWKKLDEQWVSGNWEGLSRDTYTYDSSGYLISEFIERYYNAAWTNSQLANFTNNPDGSVQQSILQLWLTTDWLNSSQKSFTYNSAGKLLSMTTATWNGAWTNPTHDLLGYDASNFLINKFRQEWANGNWQDNARFTYTNNPDGRIAISVSENRNAAQNVWLNNQKATYTYFPLAVSKPHPAAFEIFPNPVQDKLTIATGNNELANCKIYDMQGRLILTSGSFLNAASIDFKNLSSNTYLIQLEQGNTTTTKKVIKN